VRIDNPRSLCDRYRSESLRNLRGFLSSRTCVWRWWAPVARSMGSVAEGPIYSRAKNRVAPRGFPASGTVRHETFRHVRQPADDDAGVCLAKTTSSVSGVNSLPPAIAFRPAALHQAVLAAP
jgi:hypothetical protein